MNNCLLIDGTKDNLSNLNIINDNNHLSISFFSYSTNNYFSNTFTQHELIQINNKFNSFNTLSNIYTCIIDYLETNNHKIIINISTTSITITLPNFFNNETLTFILHSSSFKSKIITIQSNKITSIKQNQLYSIKLPMNSDMNLNILKTNTLFRKTISINSMLFILITLALVLIVSLSYFCLNYLVFGHSFTPSMIVNKEDINLISNWIEPNTYFKYTLLYRASRDGDSAQDFHNKCDDKYPTVTLVATTDGWKFGGYTDRGWESNSYDDFDSIYRESKGAFLFSLNLQKKYPRKGDGLDICCSAIRGPTFGYGHDFSVLNKCLSSESTCFSPESYGGMHINNEFNGGKKRFMAREVEVYLVEIKKR